MPAGTDNQERAGQGLWTTRLGAMSIPVDLDAIPEQLARFATAYLLTTSGTGVKAVTCAPVAEGALRRVAGPGRGSLANAGTQPQVTLLWPPTEATEPAGFTLLVDGTAARDGDDLVVTPTGAVLHRPAGSGHGPAVPGGCG